MLPKALSALLYSSSQESGSDMIFLLVLLMLLVVLLLTSTSTRFTCIMPASNHAPAPAPLQKFKMEQAAGGAATQQQIQLT
jgi:hypothetical protein